MTPARATKPSGSVKGGTTRFFVSNQEPADGRNTDDFVFVTYQSIIRQLSPELLGKKQPSTNAKFILPVAKVVEHLPSGAVKVPFGQLRQAAPPGIFAATSDHDSQLVALPLRDILSQLKPELFARRPQRVLAPSEEVEDLFDSKGAPLKKVRVLSKEEAGHTTYTRRAEPPPTQEQQSATFGLSAPRLDPTRPSGPPLAGTTSSPPAPPATSPASATASNLNVSGPSSKKAPPPVAERIGSGAAFPTASPPASSLPEGTGKITPGPSLPQPAAASISAPLPSSGSPQSPLGQAAPSPAEVPGTSPGERLSVPVARLSSKWPEPVLEEIQKLKLQDATCEIPLDLVVRDMRSGALRYPWKQVRRWISPPPSVADSPHEDKQVELPLAVIAPMVLAKNRLAQPKRKLTAAEDIPDVFPGLSGGPAPEASPPSAPATAAQTPALPSAPPASPAGTKPAAETLTLKLDSLWARWPSTLRERLQQNGLGEAVVHLPLAVIEPGLKAGRLAVPWHQLARQIEPAPPIEVAGLPVPEPLELPLNVIAPLFLKRKPVRSAAPKAPMPSDIPDVFLPTTSAESTSDAAEIRNAHSLTSDSARPNAPRQAVPPSRVESPARSHQADAPVPSGEPKAPATAETQTTRTPRSVGMLFGQPDKLDWTPHEIVRKTDQIEGVIGTLVALQDGLLVAGGLPAPLKGETVAAFLPQIYGRMRQYAQELALGQCGVLSLEVEHGLLQIAAAGTLYLAVLTNPAHPLPAATLKLIARELSRQKK